MLFITAAIHNSALYQILINISAVIDKKKIEKHLCMYIENGLLNNVAIISTIYV